MRHYTGTKMDQQQAAALLGYTQASWDNASGDEAQPASSQRTDILELLKHMVSRRTHVCVSCDSHVFRSHVFKTCNWYAGTG